MLALLSLLRDRDLILECLFPQLFFRDRSLFIAWGQRILGGITSFMGEQKERSVVTENPKGGINENFGRIQRGDHSNLLVR